MTAEDQSTEWKQAWQEDHLKAVCGFANGQGGRLIIGRDDVGRVVGVADAAKLLEDIPSKIRHHLGLTLDVNRVEAEGRDTIEVLVPAYTVAVSLRGRYYLRTGSTTLELTGTALTEFLLRKSGQTWDQVPEPRATLDDLDPAAVRLYCRDAARAGRIPEVADVTAEELILKLRLMVNGQLTRAAVVLFARDPGRFYQGLSVRIGRFGVDDTDLRFQEVVETNLVMALPELLEQLDRKFLIKPIRFEGLHRIEESPIPVVALREALLNALVHRTYLGSHTQIRIYDDKLTIWNDGPLPEGITQEALLRQHPSKPRNPLLADVCFKAGYIDLWGRGIQKMADACAKAGMPPPRVSAADGGMMCVFSSLHEAASSPVLTASSPVLTASSQGLTASSQGLTASSQGLARTRDGDGCLLLAALARPMVDALEYLNPMFRDHLLAASALPRQKAKLRREALNEVITKLCAGHYIRLNVLAELVNRHPVFLRDSYLSPLVKQGTLSLAYPDTLNHERQAYTTTEGLPADLRTDL